MATPTTPSALKHRNNNNSAPTSSTPILKSLLKINWKRRFKTTRTPSRFASISPTPLSSARPEKPHLVSTTKNVILLDWCLIKVKTEANSSTSPNAFTFGVRGNAFDGRASMYFCSGEIVKRYDEMTLGTGEGIIITLASLLNRVHTLENGFPSQVCDHFFLGFPCDWEEFGAQYFDEQSIHGARTSKGTRISPNDIVDPKCLLSSFDDIPVTRLFDHMMVSSGDYNECQLTRSVFDHILDEYQNTVPQIDMESRTLHTSKKFRTNINTGSGVLTRSKARLTKLRTDPDDITAEPDVTAEECAVHLVQTKNISDPCPTSEDEKSEKDASNRHVLNKLPKVNSRLDRSEVRRSGRTRNVVQYRA